MCIIKKMNVTKEKLTQVIALVGSHTTLAKTIGVSRQSISAWLRRGVPARHVIALERATGGKVTRYDLRPDLYPRD